MEWEIQSEKESLLQDNRMDTWHQKIGKAEAGIKRMCEFEANGEWRGKGV